jgi:glycosyltransferase involved in cell wall biosynthesis
MNAAGNLISVCIPAFQQPEPVLRAVNSVLDQKSCDFEIVISDDTEDRSVETALRPYLTDSRVRYFKNSVRLGAVPNWNASIRHAAGRVIKILHHDDWLCGDTSLATLAKPVLDGEAPIAFCGCRQMSVTGEELSVHRITATQLAELKTSPDCLVFGNFIGAPSVCAFDARVGCAEFDPNYTWLADAEFYIRFLKAAGNCFVYCNDALINVTTDSPAQISRFYESNRLSSVLENVRLFSSRADSKHDRKRVVKHFRQMGFGLTAREIAVAARAAIDDNGYRMALTLAGGYLRKVVGL